MSDSHVDGVAAASQSAAGAAFVLGVDGPSPSRKAGARGRTSLGGSKIPHRPSAAGASFVDHAPAPLAPEGKRPAWVSGSDAAHPVHPPSSGLGASLATGDATAAAPRAPVQVPRLNLSSMSSFNGAPSGPTAELPKAAAAEDVRAPQVIFSVGVAGQDKQAAPLRTPKGGRVRGNRYKAPNISPARAAAAATAAGGVGVPPTPFSPIAMTPIDDNTYQKSSSQVGAVGDGSPMDITPQSSIGPAGSNLFFMSPLAGVGASAEAHSANAEAKGPQASAGLHQAAPPSPALFQGFAPAASAAAPSPIFPARVANPTAALGSSASAPTAPGATAGPSSAPSNPVAPPMQRPPPAPAAAVPGAPVGSSAPRVPIQIQLPSGRDVEDMFMASWLRPGPAAAHAAPAAATNDAAANESSTTPRVGSNTERWMPRFGPQVGSVTGAKGFPSAPNGSLSARGPPSMPFGSSGGAAATLTAQGVAGSVFGSSSAWQANASTAAAAAAGKKVSDAGIGGAGGMGSGVAGQPGGNDCQPAKDNAPKSVRVSPDSATTGPPAGPGVGPSSFPSAASTHDPSGSAPAPAPAAADASSVPSASAATTSRLAAAAVGVAMASTAAAAAAASAGSAPAGTSRPDGGPQLPDFVAMTDELEALARRLRQALAAASATSKPSPSATAAAVYAALTDGLNSEAKSVLDMMLRWVVDAKQASAPSDTAAAGRAGGPGLAASVSWMLSGLRLDDSEPEAARGAAPGAAGGVGGAFSGLGKGEPAESATKAGPAGMPAAAAAAGGTPPVFVPFVFGGSRSAGSGSEGGSFGGEAAAGAATAATTATATSGGVPQAAATAASKPGPSEANPPPAPVPQAVPFVFTASPSTSKGPDSRAASSAGGAAGSGPGLGSMPQFPVPSGSAFRTAVPDAGAARPSSGGSATSWTFAFGATATPRPTFSMGASDMSTGMGPSQSGVSASGAGAASFSDAGASPMSTTPVSSNYRPAEAQPSVSESSQGWAGAAQAAAAEPPLKFSMGSSGGGAEGVSGASSAGGGTGITPGRRTRAKVTPRKTRAASQGEATANRGGSSGGGFAASGPAAAAAPAAGAPERPVSHPFGPQPQQAASSQQAYGSHTQSQAHQQQHAASQQQQHEQASSDQGLDTAAVQAVRLKRSADDKKANGNKDYEKNDFKSAERSYSEAIDVLEHQLSTLGLPEHKLAQLFPNLKTEIAVLYSNRSGARLMTGKPKSALDDALRAMDIDPKFMRAASRAATCHCRLGDFEKAEVIISAALGRCSSSSQHYQEMVKKYNEVLSLKNRVRNAVAAARAAAIDGNRDRLQEASDELSALKDQVPFCSVVAAARAVLALRLGSCRDVLALVVPHPEVPVPERAAPWRMWLTVQARYFKGDLQDALKAVRELQQALVASGAPTQPAPPAPAPPANGSAAEVPYTTTAHVTVPTVAMLTDLAEELQHQLKLKEDGNDAIKAGRAADAAELYTRALGQSLCPAYGAVLYSNRAAAYQAQGHLADAVADCGRARALDPSYYRASSRLASLMMELRRPENAQGLMEPLTRPSGAVCPGSDELTKFKDQLAEARSCCTWQKTPHHYKTLGLANTCSEDEVRKAYRRLALKFHPDKAMAAVKVSMSLPGAVGVSPYGGQLVGIRELESRLRDEASWLFNFINQANEELTDKARRRKIDQLLDAEQPPQRPGASSSSAGMYGAYGNYGGSRQSGYGAYGANYDFSSFFRHPPAGTAGSRGRTATGGGAAGGAGGYGGSAAGFGMYGSNGGARPAGSRPAPSATAGTSYNSARSGTNAYGGAGAWRAGNGAGAAGGGGAYGQYGRPGGAGRAGAAGKKYYEGTSYGVNDSDDDDGDSFAF